MATENTRRLWASEVLSRSISLTAASYVDAILQIMYTDAKRGGVLTLNNEEKILQMLESLTGTVGEINSRLGGVDSRLDGIDDRLDGIDDRLDGIDDRLDGIDGRLDKLEQGQLGLEHFAIMAENVHFPNIQLALEGISGTVERNKQQDQRLHVLEDKVDTHQIEIFALKAKLALG